MQFRSVLAGALIASAVSAAPARAQFNFFTTGTFTSASGACNGTSTCTLGGFTLQFIPKPVNPGLIGSGSIVSLGNFSLTGTDGLTSPGAVMFTLAIHQTDPATGVGTLIGTTTGAISGTVRTNPDFSSLIYTPLPSVVNIDGTRYQLIFANIGPAADRGINIAINNVGTPTSLNAIVTTTSSVPEPASMTLLATGLIGIVGAVRRKRQSS